MANVAILMGSESDRPVMKGSEDVLDQMGVDYETHVISAHRNPEKLMQYVQNARDKGIKVFIAGAGGAAALACYQKALIVANENLTNHIFNTKFKIYTSGHWPLTMLKSFFWVF